MRVGISAIIVAAGFSSRMGELKGLLSLGGRTMLEHCVTLFHDCGIEDVVVVTGHRAGEVGAVAEAAGARAVFNPGHANGSMYGSIRSGVGELTAHCPGFFLLPVDMPLLRRGTVHLLAQSFTKKRAMLSYPVFAGRRGHPPLIHGDCIAAILAERAPEGGLRALLARIEAEQPEQVREVQVADANIHLDLDTPEDFLIGRQRFDRYGWPTMAECQAILTHIHPMPDKGLAHGRAVAKVAVAMGEAINRHGGPKINLELCRVCGWLHDLAKGHYHHEAEGGRWLAALGFDRAAAIVAAHKNLDWTLEMGIGERELVYLADKLVRGNRLVGIEERFAEKLALYRENREAVRAIRCRYQLAMQLATATEKVMGQTLTTVLSEIAGVSGNENAPWW
ncbi:MAG: nucleotidyltransferase family protein [Desulfobulbaceae bacterium]|jgi:CTP:molybdopterin cytidylyltransferase MocA|nr:nucleotidyltransferase family protein [Desulfobulbaceae bacterium]